MKFGDGKKTHDKKSNGLDVKPLTGKQKAVFDYLLEYTGNNGFQPSRREMAEHFEISVMAIHCHIVAIEKKGYIELGEHKSRAIRITK